MTNTKDMEKLPAPTYASPFKTFDRHQRGPGFDSWLYPRNFSGSIGSGTGSSQPREDNWVAT